MPRLERTSHSRDIFMEGVQVAYSRFLFADFDPACAQNNPSCNHSWGIEYCVLTYVNIRTYIFMMGQMVYAIRSILLF